MIYFDNAATTGKKPKTVVDVVNKALIKYSANPGRSGHTLSVNAAEKIYNIREKISDFFGSDGAETVCFTLNCTHSINCVLKGVLSIGDRVLTTSLEHNAVTRPLRKIGCPIDFVSVSFEDDNETLSRIESKILPNTKLLMCTGASNVFGRALPLKKIGEICKRKGILFAVDGAQIAGVMPIDMKVMNIDYLCVAPHKGLYAPMGVGILICRKNIFNTIIEGGTGSNSIEEKQPDSFPEKIESGTLNLPAIFGVGAGIDYVKSIGIEKIYNHEMKLINYLYDTAQKNKNIEFYTERPKMNFYAPVLSFNYKGLPSEKCAEILNLNGIAVRGGLHCAPVAHRSLGTIDRGTVRVSVGTFNTLNEIKHLITVLSTEKNFKNS